MVSDRALIAVSVVLVAILGVCTNAPADEDDNPETGAPPGDPADIALDFYQDYLSSLRHARCRFHPSCSAYARKAIAGHGLFSGTALAADRLVRCNASAGHFYRRGKSGLEDPAHGTPHGAVVPCLEPWLLPAFDIATPAVPAAAAIRSERVREVVSFARQLAVDGDCWRAETEYLRAAHLSGADDWHLWSQFQVGACYFEAGAWADAERSYLQAGMLAVGPLRRRTAGHLLAASLFNDGRYRASVEMLPGPGLTSRALALRGLCRTARGEWGDAAADFAAGATVADSLALAERLGHMASIAALGPDLPHRSPGFAMFMSAVIPGSGQMYAGRTHDGVRHLIFNGILIYAVVVLIQNEHYQAAGGVALVGVPFYVGNIRGARYSARDFNRDRRLELTERAITEAGSY
ncbi:MAG: membrane protein insertion efficiency factor YidD [bacterium]|nr:membrane protein insertion efficiency factor YidD [bacterium]